VRTPSNLTYAVDATPPVQVTVIGALQIIGVSTPNLLIVVLIASQSGVPPDRMASVIATTMLVLSVAAAFQLCRGRFGSGYPVVPCPTSLFLLPGLLAAREGGLPLVASMTALAGVAELILSRIIGSLRPFFAPEIAGLILILSALTLGADSLFEGIGGETATVPRMLPGLGTLALLIALSVWGGRLRRLAPLIGLAGGSAAAAAWGADPIDYARIAGSPWFGLPHVGAPGLTFSWQPVPIYLIATLAVVLKEMADISTFQKLTDADWVRPDFVTLQGGILANGCANILGGLAGCTGVAPASSSVGVAAATGVTSRIVGWATAGLYLVLSFMPKIAAVLVATPRPVLAASMLYIASFVLVNGLQIVTSRLLDARRVLMIGVTLFVGVLSISHRLPVNLLPPRARAVADAPLVVSTLVAMALNIAFRIGIRRTRRLQVALDPLSLGEVEDFLDRCGAEWAALPAMITRVKFAAAQTLEMLAGFVPGNARLSVSFDEFTLVAAIAYTGDPVPLPDRQPDQRAIIEDPDATRLLAGWMLRRNADRVRSASDGQQQTLTFIFDH
jgi:NCS2 family nucleobase:cation symporter-2